MRKYSETESWPNRRNSNLAGRSGGKMQTQFTDGNGQSSHGELVKLPKTKFAHLAECCGGKMRIKCEAVTETA